MATRVLLATHIATELHLARTKGLAHYRLNVLHDILTIHSKKTEILNDILPAIDRSLVCSVLSASAPTAHADDSARQLDKFSADMLTWSSAYNDHADCVSSGWLVAAVGKPTSELVEQ